MHCTNPYLHVLLNFLSQREFFNFIWKKIRTFWVLCIDFTNKIFIWVSPIFSVRQLSFRPRIETQNLLYFGHSEFLLTWQIEEVFINYYEMSLLWITLADVPLYFISFSLLKRFLSLQQYTHRRLWRYKFYNSFC